ncbi:hypothetical protein EDD11_002702 [Mortierella claussenii]|nr:hypothetical protein EDD11_002702 [Mortierella claussenii]
MIKLSNLALLYDGKANTISLKAEGSTEHEFDATSAHVRLTAYDRVFYDHTIELSKITPFVPRFKGRFSWKETFSVPTLLPGRLPKQLFSLPAVEALASIQLYSAQGYLILCIVVPLTNTISAHSPIITIASVSLTAASVTLTAISSILASLTSAAVLTAMPLAAAAVAGEGGGAGANPGGGLSPSVWDVVSFCQFISMSGSLSLEYPELLQQWTQNFAWSMGLVSSESWNKAINGLRPRTSANLNHLSDGSDHRDRILYNTTIVNGTSNSYNTTIGNNTDILFNTTIGNNTGNPTATPALLNTTATITLISRSEDENQTVTVLSIQSDLDDAAASFVEKSVYSDNNFEAKAQTVIPTMKLDTPKFMSSSTAFAAGGHRLHQRQVPAATASLSSTSATMAPVTPVNPSAQFGADLLPSLTNSSPSTLKSFQESSSLSSLASVPTSPSAPLPSPAPSVSWPQGDYHHSSSLLTQPGLTTLGQRLNIPAKNMFMTTLFLFLILLLTSSLLALALRVALEGYAYLRPGKFTKLRRRFSSYYLGNMLRIVLLAYFAVATMAFYQLTLKDSWAITLLASMTLVLLLALTTYITLRLRRAGGTSLFFDERLKSKYGVLYDQYVLSTYWFFVPVLMYHVLKAAIIGLGHGGRNIEDSNGDINRFKRHRTSNSWAQMSLLLLVEICFAALLIWKRPFADKAPNRLNGVLGCVRVLNVILLAILIEGTSVSTVSRTVVGVMIMGTQALMMITLTILVFYQLGRALWRLWKAVKAKKISKTLEKRRSNNRLSQEGILAVSSKEKRHDGEDGDEDEPYGRMAGEHSRQQGGESITSLVGMMGIGSNPMIQYTPASDDDEDDIFGDDGDDFEQDVIPRRYATQDPQSNTDTNNSTEDQMKRIRDSMRGSIRDSTQSTESQSSLILDYYKSSYLPLSIRDKIQNGQLQQLPKQEIEVRGNNDALEASTDAAREGPRQTDLVIPDTIPEEPWVQSAYMTRRQSECNARSPTKAATRDLAFTLTRDCDLRLNRQEQEWDEEEESERVRQITRQQRQQRRRPLSVGASRCDLQPISFRVLGFALSADSKKQRCNLTSRRDSRIKSAFPRFQDIYIPDNLLVGPPPASLQPKRTSVSSAAIVTPPSLSLTEVVPESEARVLTVRSAQSIPHSSTSRNTLNFDDYRFPDERPPRVSSSGLYADANVATVAAQRNIHPLSPLHPDYQHPDDLYNACVPSPNEEGPAAKLTHIPSVAASSFTAFPFAMAIAPISTVNIPNGPQDGKNSRREDRSTVTEKTKDDSYKSATEALMIVASKTARKRVVPALRIVTTPKPFVPAPQIPIPALPVTPYFASIVIPSATSSAEAGIASKRRSQP